MLPPIKPESEYATVREFHLAVIARVRGLDMSAKGDDYVHGVFDSLMENPGVRRGSFHCITNDDSPAEGHGHADS